MWQRQAERDPNIAGGAVLNSGECQRQMTAVNSQSQTKIGRRRRLGFYAQLMESVQHIGAGLIKGGGKDVQIGGQDRTDFHHRIVLLGAPERGSSLPVPNRRVACRVGNLRREPGPVALTVSHPPTYARHTVQRQFGRGWTWRLGLGPDCVRHARGAIATR